MATINFEQIDKFFEDKTFVNGQRLSVADLALVTSINYQQKPEFKNLNRYCNTVKAVKASWVPESAKQNNSADLLDQLEKAQSKPKDPFSALPPTTFDFDDFKRKYSNNPADVYLPYFWEKFDEENSSIWFCEYKYADELGLVFMSSNLIRGALQRLDKARKQSFGSMIVFGQDHNNTIAGLWVWRGQDLMFNLTEDWQVDYESFNWKKLDPKSEETKKLVEQFFKQSEDCEYQGMKYADSKIFK